MSGEFDDLIERLTTRLAADPELRMEIGQELRTHLDECAAEFARGGMTSDDAKAAATKALGDEIEIADKLWQANRRRIRLRKAARWAFGVSAGPVAAVAVVAVGWSALVSIVVCVAGVWFYTHPSGGLPFAEYPAIQIAEKKLLGTLGPESRAVFERSSSFEEKFASARSAAQKNPGDKSAAANYVLYLMMHGVRDNQTDKPEPDRLQGVLDECRHGSELDAGNAFFPLMSAAVLFDYSSSEIIPPEVPPADESFSYDAPWKPEAKDRVETFTIQRQRIDDPETFRRGLAEFHAAAQCSFLDDHVTEVWQRQLDMLPAPTRYADHLIRQMEAYSILIPNLNEERAAQNCATSMAFEAAQQGRRDEALSLIGDEQRISKMEVQRPSVPVELVVGLSLHCEAFGNEAVLSRLLNLSARADMAQSRYVDLQRGLFYAGPFFAAQDPIASNRRHLSADWFNFETGQWKRRPEEQVAEARRAEYAVVDQTAFTVTALFFALIAGGMYLLGRLRSRKPVLFLGWRSLILGTAAALIPVAVYMAYAWLMSNSGRGFGIPASLDRLLVEYTAVAVAVGLAISTFADRALGIRAKQIGATFAAIPTRRSHMIVHICAAAGLIAFLAVWNNLRVRAGPGDLMPTGNWWIVLVPLMIVYGLGNNNKLRLKALTLTLLIGAFAWMFSNYADLTWNPLQIISFSVVCALIALDGSRFIIFLARDSGGDFNRAVSHAPLFITTAIAMICVAGPILRWQERRAVVEMDRTNSVADIRRGLDTGPWHDLQQRVLAEAAAP